MKSFSIAMVFLFTGIYAFAQANKFQTAWYKVEEYKTNMKNSDLLLEALEAINETVQNESQSTKSKVWYYKALINHLIYENETISPQHPDALFNASEAYQKALTVEVGKKPYEPENTKGNLYNLAGQAQNKGAQLYNQNDLDNANRYFMEVRSIKKFFDTVPYDKKLDDSDATFNAALCLFKLKRKDEAKVLLKELIERKYDSPTIYQIYSSYFFEEGDDAKALEILSQGIARYPNEVSLIIDELNIYIKQEKVGEHITKLEKAAAMDSNNAQIWYALGAAYDELADKATEPTTYFEKAEAAYLKCISKDPQHYNAYNNLGALYYNQGVQLNKDMMDNSKLTDKQFNDLQTKRNDLYKKALPYFERAYEIKADELSILQALKEVYAKLEMYDKSKTIKEQMDRVKQTKQ